MQLCLHFSQHLVLRILLSLHLFYQCRQLQIQLTCLKSLVDVLLELLFRYVDYYSVLKEHKDSGLPKHALGKKEFTDNIRFAMTMAEELKGELRIEVLDSLPREKAYPPEDLDGVGTGL